jgi:hypothetical protein
LLARGPAFSLPMSSRGSLGSLERQQGVQQT